MVARKLSGYFANFLGFCVSMGFFCVQMLVSLHLYVFLMLFNWLSPLFADFVLLCFLVVILLAACFLTRDRNRKRKGVDRNEGEDLGGAEGCEATIRIYYMKNLFSIKKIKISLPITS